MKQYKIEMSFGQDFRIVEADLFTSEGEWMIFWRMPPQGGPKVEYWRVMHKHVVSVGAQT